MRDTAEGSVDAHCEYFEGAEKERHDGGAENNCGKLLALAT